MQVIKRNNKKEPVSFDKVIRRIENLCGKDDRFSVLSEIQTVDLAKNIIMTIVDNITTKELDNQAIKACMSVSISEPEYGELAKRFYVSSMHKEATSTFYETAEKLYEANLLHHTVMKTIRENKDIVNSAIDTFRDYNLDYFGLKTLEKSYLIKAKGIMETPQYLFMRVSLGLYKTNLTEAFKSYYFLSQKMFTHASPTLFNSGTIREQNSSCFLLGTEDSIEGIMKTYTSCAYYSKWSGGIGIHVSNIRSKGSLIRKTNGKSDGIIPMLKVYNELSLYINQGGKRNGSFAIYLEPHHADVLDFLKIKNGTTDQSMACKNLFTALWISDYFMECVNSGDTWYLMCPDACPGLTDVFGKDYTVLYKKYVSEKKFTKKIPARVLFKEMLSAQTLSGSPYVLFKDSINIKNNQKHLGTIKSSNLCSEICLFSDSENHAVCNLISICLSKYNNNGNLDIVKLEKVIRQSVRNLNQVIDNNFYPTKESEKTNLANRPIGIGVQGLANLFYDMKISFESKEAKEMNLLIFETIQYYGLDESCKLAKKHGSYPNFKDSPASKGIFQHNMWEINEYKLHYNWENLRKDVLKYGLRNSTITALPPTASTSQIMGNFESFEPITSNVFIRNTLSGSFPVINNYLVQDLKKLNLWTKKIKTRLISENGSIQNILEIPEETRKLYKTVWEIPQKVLIELSADRSPFICQSQSLNLYMKDPDQNKLYSALFYGWKLGLKTGMYYLRTFSSTDPIKFTIDDEICLSCSA